MLNFCVFNLVLRNVTARRYTFEERGTKWCFERKSEFTESCNNGLAAVSRMAVTSWRQRHR